MDEETLKAIEARANALPAEPWRAVRFGEIWFVEHGPENNPVDCYDLFEDPSQAVCVFVAHAREDVPALLAEVRLLQAIAGDRLADDARLAEGFRRGVLAVLDILNRLRGEQKKYAKDADESGNQRDYKEAITAIRVLIFAADAVRDLLDGR